MRDNKYINLSHGSGAKLSYELINDLIVRKLHNAKLEKLEDSASLRIPKGKISFSTDSYIIDPIFFQGGDIGKLAICGTVNDLAVSGAEPKYISLGFIIEEGFNKENLKKILKSIASQAKKAGVEIVTGDTKVVERGKVDKIFINTTGIGIKLDEFNLAINRVSVGDKIIISGSIGDHEIAVLSSRGDFDFKANIKSDCACLYQLIVKLKNFGDKIKFMRDPTRGGLGCVLNEIIYGKDLSIVINEANLPVKDEVGKASQLLGFDVLYLANEGKVIIFTSADIAEDVVSILKQDKLGKDASIIGEVTKKVDAKVVLKTTVGGQRIVHFPEGLQLPRIC